LVAETADEDDEDELEDDEVTDEVAATVLIVVPFRRLAAS
jgi:hypothetical protein